MTNTVLWPKRVPSSLMHNLSIALTQPKKHIFEQFQGQTVSTHRAACIQLISVEKFETHVFWVTVATTARRLVIENFKFVDQPQQYAYQSSRVVQASRMRPFAT
jgi:hypothetical protein